LIAARGPARQRFFGLKSLFEGFAKAEETEDTAGPAAFCAAVFLGFLISRFDRT
jgi:hypothetical protein